MWFFESWSEIGRVAAEAAILYAGLIIIVRLSGELAPSRMNNFDWIVNIAVGATMGTTIMVRRATAMEGLTALVVLFGMKHVITRLSFSFRGFHRLVQARPTLLYYDGEFIEGRMRQTRVTKDEILSEVRGEGLAGLDEVWAVVLESSARLSVVRRSEAKAGNDARESIAGLPGHERHGS